MLGFAVLFSRSSQITDLAAPTIRSGAAEALRARGAFPVRRSPPASFEARALGFGLGAPIQKSGGVDPFIGLPGETILVLPAALVYIFWTGPRAAADDGSGAALFLIASGAITALPLMLYMAEARRLKLSTTGIMAHLAPTPYLALAVLTLGEPFTTTHALIFGLVWTALVLFAHGAFRRARTTGFDYLLFCNCIEGRRSK